MKILHINTYDQGGAAIAAIRLHKALLESKIDSKILFLHKTNNSLPNSYSFMNSSGTKPGFLRRQCSRVRNRILLKYSKSYINNQKLQNKPECYELFSFNSSDLDITTQKIYQEVDIVHIHWIAGFLDYRFFRKNKKPVIWTLHDMNPFTGGCHYSTGCEKYIIECRDCPQLQGTIDPDNSFLDQEYKRSFLNDQTFVITAPSDWLAKCSSKSRLFSVFSQFTIPYSLDLSIFKPQNKSFCRSALNLPVDKKILLFVSADIKNKRKGFDILLDALSGLDQLNVQICAVGERDDTVPDQTKITYLGKISEERLMALVYSAADAFVLPSREDNLPNVMLESISCGTPVIAFPVGGMQDVIISGFNGILANGINSESLASAIKELLEDKYKFDSTEIGEYARQMFSPVLQAEKYLTLYKKMLERKSCS